MYVMDLDSAGLLSAKPPAQPTVKATEIVLGSNAGDWGCVARRHMKRILMSSSFDKNDVHLKRTGNLVVWKEKT